MGACIPVVARVGVVRVSWRWVLHVVWVVVFSEELDERVVTGQHGEVVVVLD